MLEFDEEHDDIKLDPQEMAGTIAAAMPRLIRTLWSIAANEPRDIDDSSGAHPH